MMNHPPPRPELVLQFGLPEGGAGVAIINDGHGQDKVVQLVIRVGQVDK